ncbi:hypothetical protein CBS147339_7233 [Penicillium roqueforti]|nr:hypothetical protein DTO012A8_8427 [Penicillium roqueforti]KAI3071264.1 hypothetical protein CBS147339_7233 [Penicillium roqueforti]KAI3101289.1 hypothetical protein CBS147338_3149 [Penicillium roqueforti]KAI3128004.1 hypothetical protein CBS147325_9924 [Penicillium roqueforti]KAI3183701.1 hypothetical protein DTO032C6_6608 [Penicillium roqueforti]
MPAKRKVPSANDDSPVGKRTAPKPGSRAYAKQLLNLMTETDMACTVADEEKYAQVMEWSQRETNKRLDAETNYAERALWTPGEEPPTDFGKVLTAAEMAEAPLCIENQIDQNGEWVPPPRGVKLSDEGVYLAAKNMTAVERGQRFPVDFDKNGHVRATRIPEDPAPLGWAHGLPMIMVARGIIPLVGREHATKLGNLTLKTDANIKNSPAFTVGPVVASKSFVEMSRSIQRQYVTHKPDREYKMEYNVDTAVDMVSNDHQDMAILLGDSHTGAPSRLVRLVDFDGYQIERADKTKNNNAYVVPRTFFKKYGIPGYDDAKHRLYENCKDPLPKPEGSQSISSSSTSSHTLVPEQPEEAKPTEETDITLIIKLNAIEQLDSEGAQVAKNIHQLGHQKQEYIAWYTDDATTKYEEYKDWINGYNKAHTAEKEREIKARELAAQVQSVKMDFSREVLKSLLLHYVPNLDTLTQEETQQD